MKTIKYIITIVIFGSATVAFSQDTHFSQYNYAYGLFNPATVGAYKDLQATIQHKEQWRSANAFRTSAVSFEYKFGRKGGNNSSEGGAKGKLLKGLAMGVTIFNDNAGDAALKHFQANFNLVYHALLNANNMLSAGLIGGYAQKSINPDKIRWNNQYTINGYDASIQHNELFSNQTFAYPDFGLGMLWSHGEDSKYMTANDQKHVHVGFSVLHVNSPKNSFLGGNAKLPWRYTAHTGFLIGISGTQYSFGGSAVYMNQNKAQEILVGGLCKYQLKESSKYTGSVKGSAISLGCYYRNKDAVIPYVMYEYDVYSFAISYDTNISGLKGVTKGRGGVEISLRYNTPSPFGNSNSRSRFYSN